MDHHTPGSWEPRIMEMSKKDWAALNCGPIQVVCRGQDVIAAVWCGDDRNTTEAANAHLIAAAPDLLEALKAYMALEIVKRNNHIALFDRASAAIAKAVGR